MSAEISRTGLQTEANFCELSRTFIQVAQVRSDIAYCYREISLEMPQNSTRLFVQIYGENLREQKMKFANFICITFAQYCMLTHQD